MKYPIIVGALFTALFFCACGTEEEGTKESKDTPSKNATSTEVGLTLNVTNPPETPIFFYKVEDIGTGRMTPVDTIRLNEGKFSSTYNEQPGLYNLKIGESSLMLAIDQGQTLTVDVDAGDVIGSAKVKGSPDTDILFAYERYRKQVLDDIVNPVRREVQRLKKEGASQEEIEEVGKEEMVKYKDYQNALMDFVKDSVGTSIALYATSLRWTGDEHIPFLEERVKEFKSEHPDLAITERLDEKVRRMKQVAMGATPPDITLPNPQGTEVSLMDNLGSKYTLIDFWASWCAPCRREASALVSLYDQFHDKGFEIYAVSLDNRKEKWVQAIKQDGRNWINVSSFEVYATPAVQEYSVNAVPHNFLLDSTGTIVARDLQGDDLVNRISDLME